MWILEYSGIAGVVLGTLIISMNRGGKWSTVGAAGGGPGAGGCQGGDREGPQHPLPAGYTAPADFNLPVEIQQGRILGWLGTGGGV